MHLFQNPSSSKTADLRRKFWDMGTLAAYIWCSFGLVVVFNVSFGTFGVFVPRWSLTRKWMFVEGRGDKCGIRGHRYHINDFLLTVLVVVLKVILGSFLGTCSKMALYSRTAGRRSKRVEIANLGTLVDNM